MTVAAAPGIVAEIRRRLDEPTPVDDAHLRERPVSSTREHPAVAAEGPPRRRLAFLLSPGWIARHPGRLAFAGGLFLLAGALAVRPARRALRAERGDRRRHHGAARAGRGPDVDHRPAAG